MIISDGSQNHYNFCKYHFPNLFTARHETNLINKMCFLLRIFNYGIICSDNKTILDCRGQNKKCFFSLLSPSLQAELTCLPHCSSSTGELSLAPPRTSVLPASGWSRGRLTDPARPAEMRRKLRPGVVRPVRARQRLRSQNTGGDTRWRGWQRLAEAGPGVAVNLIKENLKHFRPFTLFYYLMTLIGE